MRIGIDTHFATTVQATGNRTYTVELVDALLAEDARHEYILYAVEDHPYYHKFAGKKNVTIRYNLAHNGWIRNYVSLPQAIARDKLDVAHLLFLTTPYITTPVVLWLPDLYYVHNQQGSWYERGIGQLTRWGARWAAHIVTLSEYSRQDILQTLSLPPDRVSITSAAANKRFVPVTDEGCLAQTRVKLGIDRNYILFVGRTEDTRKNIPALLDAYIRLRSAGQVEEQLVIAGRHGPGTAALRDTVQAAGMEADVLLPGIIADDDLPALLSGAQVFAYAPSFEGFGLPVLEALSCGTPVITSNVTSLPEVAGDAAVYVAPGSIEQMESALYRVLSHSELRQCLRAKGLAQSAKFSWHKTAGATLRVLEQTVSACTGESPLP
jgi:glycosyltransferase involved in cell wall biosynthesis